MTPEEWADMLGDVIENHKGSGGSALVEVWRCEIAAAICEAVAAEREAIARWEENECDCGRCGTDQCNGARRADAIRARGNS